METDLEISQIHTRNSTHLFYIILQLLYNYMSIVELNG